MGTCSCRRGVFGATLDFIWSEGNNSYTWNGPPQYCNPYNCSNSKCYQNGCAQARKGFCTKYGVVCPCKGNQKLCYNDCPCCTGDLCQPADVDIDCDSWGPARPVCAFLKGGAKAVQGIVDPLGKYGWIFLLGFGGLALFMILKR